MSMRTSVMRVCKRASSPFLDVGDSRRSATDASRFSSVDETD